MGEADIIAKIARNNQKWKELRDQADHIQGENYRLNRELRRIEEARQRK